MENAITEFSEESHLKGNKYFRVVHGKTDKSRCVGLHRHDFVEVLWIRSGEGMLISGGRERYFSHHLLFISRPNEVHVIESARDSTIDFSYVAIPGGVFARFVRDCLSGEEEFFRGKFGGMSMKLSSFETAYLDRAASELVWQNDSLMAVYRFLINLYWQIKSVFASALPGNMPDWLSDACQRIRNPENLALGLEKFREICGKDMSYINRAMRKYLNCTPTEYINGARLRYAKWLLATSSFSTGEISEICGFSDLPYFCRKFKEAFDSTPGAYRSEYSQMGGDAHDGSRAVAPEAARKR